MQVAGGEEKVVGPLDFTGFKTPAGGDVDAHVATWTYEGDRAITKDYLALGKLSQTCGVLPRMSDAANPADNFFNGTISTGGMDPGGRTPQFANQLGFDRDRLLGARGHDRQRGALAPGFAWEPPATPTSSAGSRSTP